MLQQKNANSISSHFRPITKRAVFQKQKELLKLVKIINCEKVSVIHMKMSPYYTSLLLSIPLKKLTTLTHKDKKNRSLYAF